MTAMRKAGRGLGFALMMAVFMIVILAAIAVYLLTVATGQLEAISQDVQGVKAYQAARAGLDWGAYNVLRNSACAGKSLDLANDLAGYRAVVTCSAVGFESEGAASVQVFRLQSTGCNQTTCPAASPGPTYVERQLQLTITK